MTHCNGRCECVCVCVCVSVADDVSLVKNGVGVLYKVINGSIFACVSMYACV